MDPVIRRLALSNAWRGRGSRRERLARYWLGSSIPTDALRTAFGHAGRLRSLLAQRAAISANSAGGVLCGLPITLKESMNVRGMRTTVGMPMWAQFRSEHDGTMAERTRAQGAVLLGKTNVAPMLADWQCNHPIYGRTNNPWDLDRSPAEARVAQRRSPPV